MQALLSQWWRKELHLWMLSPGSTKFSVSDNGFTFNPVFPDCSNTFVPCLLAIL